MKRLALAGLLILGSFASQAEVRAPADPPRLLVVKVQVDAQGKEVGATLIPTDFNRQVTDQATALEANLAAEAAKALPLANQDPAGAPEAVASHLNQMGANTGNTWYYNWYYYYPYGYGYYYNYYPYYLYNYYYPSYYYYYGGYNWPYYRTNYWFYRWPYRYYYYWRW